MLKKVFCIKNPKSRINWLSMGDSNSEFFFTTVKIQKAKNNINLLQNDQGEIITPPDEIQHEMVSFNKKLLGTCANTLASINLVEV